MPNPIEDYALVSNCRTAALISRDGSIDDVHAERQAGNTPQAFSHLTLVRAADALARSGHKTR